MINPTKRTDENRVPQNNEESSLLMTLMDIRDALVDKESSLLTTLMGIDNTLKDLDKLFQEFLKLLKKDK